MAKYALKRLILILPTLVAVLSILFILTKLLPGDPVLFSMGESERVYENSQTLSNQRYNIVAKRMGLDKPLFYFSIVPSDLPKDYYSLPPAERQYAQSLIDKYKSAALVTSLVNHYMELNQTESQVTEIDFLNFLNSFPMDLELVKQEVDVYMEEYPTHAAVIRMDELLKGILTSETPHLSYLPKVVWHGMNNQFHQWIFDALTFNIGASRINGKSAWSMIIDAIPRTLVINLLSIIIAYLLSILIGVYAGWWEGSFDTILSLLLYVLYSIPGFWLATVLVVFFTTPEYGAWTDIFPSVGIWDATSTDTQWQIIAKNADLLILPIVVLSTGFMAYLTRIVRNAVIEEKHKTYVVHARNKGLSEKSILWRHVFRNASFPLITLLGSILPAALAGSVVIEVICNVPGTGRLLFDSIMNQDWPVVIGVVLISSVLTIIGLLISDILYQWADPRVNFSRA